MNTRMPHTVAPIAMLGLITLLLLAVLPTTAHAQVTHGGVDVARLVPDGMEILDVIVPARAEIPVRLALAPRDAQRATLLVDVLVATDATRAREALAWQIGTVQGDVAASPGLGDVGYADGGYAAFARDNVLVVVRRVDVPGGAALDIRALAARFDHAVLASPPGATRASVMLQLPRVDAMTVGATARIALPAGALDADIETVGGASARRTRNGFMLTRTGSAPAHLDVVVVDRRLRTTR